MHENQYVIVDQRVYIIGGDLVITLLRPTDAGRYVCMVSTQVTNSLDAEPRVLLSNISILSVSGMVTIVTSISLFTIFTHTNK